jgi:hypothetical protein
MITLSSNITAMRRSAFCFVNRRKSRAFGRRIIAKGRLALLTGSASRPASACRPAIKTTVLIATYVRTPTPSAAVTRSLLRSASRQVIAGERDRVGRAAIGLWLHDGHRRA